MSLGRLVTFGYQGLRGSDDLRQVLDGFDVTTVFDIRLNPWSSQVAFSLGTRRTVAEAGLDYVHEPRLGNLAYKTGGILIKDLDAIERVLTALRAGHNVALMCVCRTVDRCHRRAIAEEAVRRLPGLAIQHLTH